MSRKQKHSKQGKHKIILALLTILFILGITYIIFYIFDVNRSKKANNNILENIVVNEAEITEKKTERMLQVEELQKENTDIVGWLEIEDTNIDYAVVQGADNDYYLTHNYKKEYASTGSIFLDKDFNLINGSSNLLMYGHRNKQGLMFEDLIKYKDENFYKEHKQIRFTTDKEDSTYDILAVFYSKVYYKSDKNVFRYYYFVNAESEAEYNEYVKNCKEASIYDTGVEAEYGEQLLTLSTCEYTQENGRFVVVARKQK